MKRKTLVLTALLGTLLLSAEFALTVDQKKIYGNQLSTEKERAKYCAQMRAAKTAEEREQIRMEHHELMKKRADELNLTLPDEPPARRSGMGAGGGMGPGGGMKPGGSQ